MAAEWEERLGQPNGTGAELPARLAAAAQAEALRADADTALASDLELASRAAGALAQAVVTAREVDRGRARPDARARIYEPLGQYESALGQLLRDRGKAGEARTRMMAWVGDAAAEPVEALALWAAAAWERHDDAGAARLDARLAEEIGRSSREESARFVEEMNWL